MISDLNHTLITIRDTISDFNSHNSIDSFSEKTFENWTNAMKFNNNHTVVRLFSKEISIYMSDWFMNGFSRTSFLF